MWQDAGKNNANPREASEIRADSRFFFFIPPIPKTTRKHSFQKNHDEIILEYDRIHPMTGSEFPEKKSDRGLVPVFGCGSCMSAVEPSVGPCVEGRCEDDGCCGKGLCGDAEDEDDGEGVHDVCV